jgi:hypothetical protein
MSKLYENIKKTEKIFHSERRFIFNIILVKVSQLENNVIHPTINFNFFYYRQRTLYGTRVIFNILVNQM